MKKIIKTKEVKVNNKVNVKEYSGMSISQINFSMLSQGKSFLEIEIVVKSLFPESKYQKTHYYWYIQRRKKQMELGLDTTHLKFTTAKIYDLLSEKKKVTKVSKKEDVKKILKKTSKPKVSK